MAEKVKQSLDARAHAGDGDGAVAELQARIEARREERLQRDRKLREEWLGRNYLLSLQHELLNVEQLRMRLIGYDPYGETVFMRPLWAPGQPAVPWSTDQFWDLINSGQLKEEA